MYLLIIGIVVALIFLAGLLIFHRQASPKEVDVSEEGNARRFAKLLIAEIRLYNRGQVAEGRQSKDLYRRLKKEVDGARRMYEERVAEGVAGRADYFHEALVNELAGGDASALGADYRRG